MNDLFHFAVELAGDAGVEDPLLRGMAEDIIDQAMTGPKCLSGDYREQARLSPYGVNINRSLVETGGKL
ncbi:MAG: hypothetical protein ABIH37_04140 [archaeon]